MELERAQIRLTGLEIRDYKNVKHGFLSLENPGSGYEAGILGLYGQNGSGKTAVIDALSLLKLALSGESIPARLGEYIHVDANRIYPEAEKETDRPGRRTKRGIWELRRSDLWRKSFLERKRPHADAAGSRAGRAFRP